MEDGIRINKFLSEIGYCSRREADKLVEQGRVTVNNKAPQIGQKVTYQDRVHVDGELVSKPDDNPIYIAFNKPKGIVCTTDTQNEKDNIIDFIRHPKRIFPIGRLDKLSEGLIFLTSDGDIVNKILRAHNRHEKEYVVTVDKPITPGFIKKMSNGLPILGKTTKKCTVKSRGKYVFTIVLTQGLNRQIRRMCEYLDYKVTKLKRVRIMNVNLDIPLGEWRDLSETELKEIKEAIGKSTKTSRSKKPAKKGPGLSKNPKANSGKKFGSDRKNGTFKKKKSNAGGRGRGKRS